MAVLLKADDEDAEQVRPQRECPLIPPTLKENKQNHDFFFAEDQQLERNSVDFS